MIDFMNTEIMDSLQQYDFANNFFTDWNFKNYFMIVL